MENQKEELEKYVTSIVKKYTNRGRTADELFETGMIEAKKIINSHQNDENYDIHKDKILLWSVRQAITRKIYENYESKVSKEKVELINKYCKLRRKYFIEHNNHEPSNKEMADFMNITESEIIDIKRLLEQI